MTVLVRCLRSVLALGPSPFRARYEAEILDAFSAALAAERLRRGRIAMLRLWLRSLWDTLRTVRRERSIAASAGRGSPLRDGLGDVRFVFRSWRRAPGFAVTVVATLVLALGLASAIFAFADGYLFRPSPFPDADRLYFVTDPDNTSAGLLRASDQSVLRQSGVAHFGFVEWSVSHRAVSGELLDGDRRIGVFAYGVSPGFRATVELPLIAGRDFRDADHRQEAPIAAWLSHRYWQREFGGDYSVLGRTYRIQTPNGGASTVEVVGILGPQATSFDLNNAPPDIVVPAAPEVTLRPNLLALPIVRLPGDVSRQQAADRIAAALQSVAPAGAGRSRTVRLRSLHENRVAGGRPTARVLFAGALLVVGLASINLVYLLLTRGVSRAGEIATRAALGASSWRVTRLFLTEGLLFGLAGIAGGLVAGAWLANLIDARIPRLPTGGRNMALVPMIFDARTIVFTLLLGLAVPLAGSLWPARRALRRSLAWTSRSAAGVAGSISAKLSRTILTSELAVATVVMVGTLFIGLGIWRYLHQPLGFDYQDRFRVTVTRDGGQMIAPLEVDAVIRAVATVPGVTAAGPLRLVAARDVDVSGRALGPNAIGGLTVTPGYFETWHLRLLRGRWFARDEFADGLAVAVVDRRAAETAWPGQDPVGQEIRIAGIVRRVIGVIEPRRTSLSRDAAGQVYVPAADQSRWTSAVVWAPRAPIAPLASQLVAAATAVAPGTEVRVEPVTLESLFLRETGEAMFQAPIVAAFGALAFLLAGIGVFGLVSYLVEQRRQEFGIRLALGARPRDVWRHVVQQSVTPAIVGLALGVGVAWALESVVRTSVFGWQSSGAAAVTAVAAALGGVAILAATVPAARAMRIDPVVTVRME